MADVSPAPGGRTILGLKPRTAMIAGGVVLAVSIGYLLWKRRSASGTAAAAQSSSAASGTSGIDYGGELSVIQSELEDLLAAEGRDTSGGSAGTGTGGGSPGGGSGTGTPPGVGEAGEGTVPGTGGGTGTKTKPKPGVPTGVHPTKTTANAVTLTWNKAPNATSYRVRATYQGKLVGSQQTVNGTSATVSGLHPDHTYTFHVAAVGPGGTSSETNGPAVKTSR